MADLSIDRLYGVSSGLAIKAPVRAATADEIVLSGLQTVDGIALAAGDRVLVKAQADQSEHGVYRADTGAWTRAVDFDGSRDVVGGVRVFVLEGATNALTEWVLTNVGTVVIGATELTFSLLNSAASADGQWTESRATAAAGQSTVDVAYAVGAALVTVNGAVIPSSDYAATNGSTIAFDAPLSFGDEVVVYSVKSVLALPAIYTDTLGRLGIGPGQDSQLAQYSTAFGVDALSGATSTLSDGSDRLTETPGNPGEIEKADFSAAVGHGAGVDAKGHAMTLMGNLAGADSEGYVSTAIGQKSFYTGAGTHFSGLGYRAGESLAGDHVTALGYVAMDSAVADNCVALGNFSYRFGYGDKNVLLGRSSGEAALLEDSVGVGFAALRGSNATGVVALGGDNFAGIEVTGNAFSIPASAMDVDENRINLTAGTAASNGWADGASVVLKWDGSALTNPPVGLGAVSYWYRFQVSIDGANEHLLPIGIVLAENEAGPASGSATATPIDGVSAGFVIGNGFGVSADNAGGVLADADEAETIKFGLATRHTVIKLGAAGNLLIAAGAGSPEGALAADVGSTYHRTDGGGSTSFYVKESGTGAAGWAAK